MEISNLKRDLGETLRRALRLDCPVCGLSSIVDRPFHIKHHCPQCHSLFKREEGFFVGAILLNVVMSEIVILFICFVCLLVFGAEYSTVLIVLFIVAVVFPIGFFHHSWGFWLAFDHLVESLPKYER